MFLVGQGPVAKEPVFASGAWPAVFYGEQAVGHVLFGVGNVALHVGIVPAEEPYVAVLLVGLPRGVGDEGAPEGASAALPEGWPYVRHLAVVALGIGIALQPVAVEGVEVVLQLRGQDGGVAVAAVALTLDVGAIDHVSAERQTAEGVVNHVVDGVEVLVAADEGCCLLVAGVYEHAGNVGEGGLMVQPFYLDVAVGVVVELVLEGFFSLAAGDVVVGEDAFVEVATEGEPVAVADGDALSLAEMAEADACPAHDATAHIDHPLAVRRQSGSPSEPALPS